MEEMRVQIEAREPTDGEIRAFWFTLPIDTEQVEELLGIDVDTDYYYITGKELPFADLKEDYGELMCYFTDLDELHRYRNDIIHYSWCKNMTDVARHILNNDPDFTSLSESVTRYFDYEAYGQYLDDNGRFVETDHGIYELP